MTTIASRLQVVRQRIHAAATAAGRSPDDIGLIAVSKTFPPQAIFEAICAGQVAFGENYVQEAVGKIAAVAAMLRVAPANDGSGSASPDVGGEIHGNRPETADLDKKRISLTAQGRVPLGEAHDAAAGNQPSETSEGSSSGAASPQAGPLLLAPGGRVAVQGADSSESSGDARHSSAVASPEGPLLRAPDGHVALTSAATDESCSDVRHSSGVASPEGPLLRAPDGHVALTSAASDESCGDVRHSSGVASPEGPLLRPPEWHFIGPIQSNKTRVIAEQFDWVHSVDRLKIAQRLSDARPARLAPLNVCIQVNVSGEASKSGVSLEAALPLAVAVAALPRLRLRGLMAIPEPTDDNALQRRRFAALRELRDRIATHGLDLDTLSMGMSDDFEAAIAEGATLVRVGRAIFGERTRSNPA